MKSLILSAVFTLSLWTSAVRAEMVLTFEEARSAQTKSIQTHLSNHPDIKTAVRELNALASFYGKVSILFTDNVPDDGPFYDPDRSEIVMPYTFWSYAYDGWSAVSDGQASEEELIRLSDDVVLHTLLHEAAHALIDRLTLPITGREENAADEFAALYLIEFFPDGADMAYSAADFFSIEGEQVDEIYDEDLFSEHALDDQRFFNLICLVYGVANHPDSRQTMLDMDVSPDRMGLCEEDGPKRQMAWARLLSE